MTSTVGSKIHFKFTDENTSHRFIISDKNDKEMFVEMQNRILERVAAPAQRKMFWNDGVSLNSLNNSDDFTVAIDFAEKEAQNSGQWPCVNIQFERAAAAADDRSFLAVARRLQQVAAAVAAPIPTIERMLYAADRSSPQDRLVLLKEIEAYLQQRLWDMETKCKTSNVKDAGRLEWEHKSDKERKMEVAGVLSTIFNMAKVLKALFGTEAGRHLINSARRMLKELIAIEEKTAVASAPQEEEEKEEMTTDFNDYLRGLRELGNV